jgi:hypothetical protein
VVTAAARPACIVSRITEPYAAPESWFPVTQERASTRRKLGRRQRAIPLIFVNTGQCVAELPFCRISLELPRACRICFSCCATVLDKPPWI